MDQKAGAQISRKAFLQSFIILLILMIVAGILTRVVPAGSYQHVMQDGRLVIDTQSFQYIERPNYPFWRWFTAPFEVLQGPDALVVDTIIVFILIVSGAFAVLDKSGILRTALGKIVQRFGERKYLLLMLLILFFMLLGAFLGLFEEIVPLVPLMIALSYSLGWDALVGLGMSILATNMGFSAAITNPFTIGVAQKLAGLPLFSGSLFRVPIFIAIYAVTAWFLVSYAKKIDRHPEASLIYGEDQTDRARYASLDLGSLSQQNPKFNRAVLWFGAFIVLIIGVLIASPLVPAISDYSLPLVGILFLIGGLGAGFLSGAGSRMIGKALGEGISGMLPGIPLLMMAASIKYIVTSGGVMDTVLHSAASGLQNTTPFAGILIIYAIALLIELFIGSAGAKAVLLMPIILPLADLVGLTRQMTVIAYCFGDGFSNLAYPTNPVLLITLGLASVTYGKWMKFTWKLWLAVLPITVFFLWLGLLLNVGPF
jgi:uncharacterized ion transporter superfamily protein YfcC